MAPRLIQRKDEARSLLDDARGRGQSIGLVPTMGDIHRGHLELVRACRGSCSFSVVSIFVNPIQFGPGEDYNRYPGRLEEDFETLRAENVDLVFAPGPDEMYREGFRTRVEVGGVSRSYCGRYRPGHFSGVATVVLKLFNIIEPDKAWFGRKDAQQLFIIRRMAEDLDLPVEVLDRPTVRESDGLALSSRNRYLSARERRAAPGIYHALREAAGAVENRCLTLPRALERARRQLCNLPGFRLQYLEAVNPDTFRRRRAAGGPVLLLVAGFFGHTRLIDNVEIRPPAKAEARPGKRIVPGNCSGK